MISTYLGYKVYAQNLQQSMQRVAAEPAAARDQAYYNANIGKVKTVDQFVNNYRLLSYAMKAYGLQDLGNAKALMKKVLESNLSDPQSFVNRQNDNRYRSFAKAFNFTSSGSIASSQPLQTSSQQQDLLSRMNLMPSAMAGVQAELGQVTSVASLEANSDLYSQVLAAYGLNPKTTTTSDVTAALESNLADPNSAANLSRNAGLRALAADFNFAADGSIGAQHLLQSQQMTTVTQTAYMSAVPKDAASQAAAKTESAYYAATIPTLTSVDQIVSNPRLSAYVKTAFGIDPATTPDRLRTVLTSNLLDPKSAANTLGTAPPTAYQVLAGAFSIGTDGTALNDGSALSASNLAAATTAYISVMATNTAATNAAAKETAYFTSTAPGLTSVDALLADSRLVAYVKSAFGLPNATTSDLGAILKSNLLDPKSAANTLGANARNLAAAFNFAADGHVGAQHFLQSPQMTAATEAAYMSAAQPDAASQTAAQTESAYYASMIPTLTSVDQLVSNKRLAAYVKTAFGLDSATTPDQLRAVLTSNLLDPKSAANTLGTAPPTAYQVLAGAFSIGTDGTAWDHGAALSAANLSAATTAYTSAAGTDDASATAAAKETDYFTSVAPGLRSVDGLLADSRLVAYVKTAFGLPNATTSDLSTILKSNLLDPSSAANTMGAAARKLAATFNFAPNGLVYAQRPLQSAASVTATTAAYQSQAGTSAAAKATAQTETDYYTSTVGRLKSVDDLLADKRIVAYISKAYNIPATDPTKLRQVLTSNLTDRKSTANTLGDGYITLATAFDISSDGGIAHVSDTSAQTRAGLVATNNAYLEQSLEVEAGDQNAGVRLALSFRAQASTITSAYSILADKTLTTVVQTALGLSSTSSKADIDSQARTITQKLNLADLKDPKKLDKFIARFAALYDVQNASNQSSVSMLF